MGGHGSGQPRATVIIPTYNRARFLGAAIASVLGQTYQQYEIVVADDGSDDGTAELVASFGDPRLRHLRLEHRGIGAALNAALAVARGTFIARLDSDDLWQPEMLETLLPILEEDPCIGFAYGRGRAMRADGTPVNQIVGAAPRWRDDGLRSMAFNDCTCNIAVVARREALAAAGGYDECLIAAEDWDMWLRVAASAPFRFVDRELVLFRHHADNLTRCGSPRHAAVLESRVRVLDKFFSSPAGQTVADMAPLAYRNVYVDHTMQLLTAHRYRRALRAFLRAASVTRRPVTMLFRNAAFIFTQQVLMQHAVSARPVERFAALRRRRRGGRPRWA